MEYSFKKEYDVVKATKYLFLFNVKFPATKLRKAEEQHDRA